MGTELEADALYTHYAEAFRENRREEQARFRELWLTAQKDELPPGELGEEYLKRIEILKSLNDNDGTGEKELRIAELEERLMTLKYTFSKVIGGKLLTYREISAALRGDSSNRELAEGLLEEADLLAENGFSELIYLRNQQAAELGWTNHWERVNSGKAGLVREFLIPLAAGLERRPAFGDGDAEVTKGKPSGADKGVSYEEAVAFFTSLLFRSSPVPPVEVILRTGPDCPQRPAAVYPLTYRPGSEGHRLGMDLPFVKSGTLSSASLSTLFHELTHLFHFASVDNRGGWAFPSELANGDLIYEAEAIGVQLFVSAAWEGGRLAPDLAGLKDLVFLAESERLLYEQEPQGPGALKEFLRNRIDGFYPAGGFRRTPLGASHLIAAEHAGRYWTYAAAFRLGLNRAYSLARGEGMPFERWQAGNQISWESLPEAELLSCPPMEELSEFFEISGDILPRTRGAERVGLRTAGVRGLL